MSNLALIAVILFLTACTTTNSINNAESLVISDDGAKVLVMPMDVELSVLTAIGALEPNAEWSIAASEYIGTAIIDKLSTLGYESEVFVNPSDDPASDYVQLEKLHEVVGAMALNHHMAPVKLTLPAKHPEFDWSLGDDAQILKQGTDADYALFVYFRDSYSSAGRVAMQVGMALLGVGVAGGQQLGFASLVNLDSGDIAWFNFLASSVGDAREPETAAKAVENLLDNLPSQIEENIAHSE